MCLDHDINVSVAEDMMEMYKEQSLEIRKVVCKDNGFDDNYTKTNIKLTLVQLMIEEELFTTV